MTEELHIRGAEKCPACCCGGGYSHENCGGRWHERIVDYNEDGYYHNYRCDKCDEKQYEYGYEDYEIEFK